MMPYVNRDSIFLNLGLLFSATFCLYFFGFALCRVFGLIDDAVVESLYTRKGIDYLTAQSLFYMVSSLIMFNLGYWAIQSWDGVGFFGRKIGGNWSFRNIFLGAICSFGGGVFSKIIGVLKGAHEHPHYWSPLIENQAINFFIFFNPLQILALILIFFGYLLAKDNKDAFWQRIYFWVFVPLFTSMLLATLMLGSKALTLGIIFPILTMMALRVPTIKSVAIVGILFGLTVTVMVGKSVFESHLVDGQANATVDSVIETFIGRVNQSHVVTQVVNVAAPPLGPRVLLEFVEHLKPKHLRDQIIENGNEFGRMYGFIGADDRVTGVGRTVVAGLYLSFGFVGVMMGMFVLGVLYRLISDFAAVPVGFIFFVFTLFNMLVRIEQDMIFLIITLCFHLTIAIWIHFMVKENGVFDKLFLWYWKFRY